MSREEIVEKVANYFNVEVNYDMDDSNWECGCYLTNREFLSLKEVVYLIESRFNKED